MDSSSKWEEGIKAELQTAAARTCQRIKHVDPWYRALACCLVAQRIREKRSRDQFKAASKVTRLAPMDWETALREAREKARQKAFRLREKGSWNYALKVKLTAWRLKAKECANHMS